MRPPLEPFASPTFSSHSPGFQVVILAVRPSTARAPLFSRLTRFIASELYPQSTLTAGLPCPAEPVRLGTIELKARTRRTAPATYIVVAFCKEYRSRYCWYCGIVGERTNKAHKVYDVLQLSHGWYVSYMSLSIQLKLFSHVIFALSLPCLTLPYLLDGFACDFNRSFGPSFGAVYLVPYLDLRRPTFILLSSYHLLPPTTQHALPLFSDTSPPRSFFS